MPDEVAALPEQVRRFIRAARASRSSRASIPTHSQYRLVPAAGPVLMLVLLVCLVVRHLDVPPPLLPLLQRQGFERGMRRKGFGRAVASKPPLT